MAKHLVLLTLFLPGLVGPTAQRPAPDIQGHRGCRGLMPENTIPAMRRALDLGVTTLEMDAAISQDGQVLLSHDSYLNAEFVYRPDGSPLAKSEGKSLQLYSMPYAQIRRYDVGSHGNPTFPQQQAVRTYKPLLAEVIDSAEAYARRRHRPAPFYNIETKSTPEGDGINHPAPAKFVQLVLAVITAKGVQSRCIIQSFDPRTLEVVHRTQPRLRTALLVENVWGLDYNLRRLSFQPSIYSPNYHLVTADLVQACHQQHIQVIPWTVNTAAEATQLLAQQVDSLITDYSNLLLQK